MNHSFHTAALCGLVPVALASLGGCASAPAPTALPARLPDFITSRPAVLQPYLTQLYAEGDRNAVLNFDRLGVAALAHGQHALAAKAFDQSIQRIESVRTGGRDVEAAKSKFSTEASKDFKGEPYEKAMAYYYRGLLYLHAGDLANAAASFGQVNVEDGVAEQESYQADYASAKFLQAWALRCNGEQATSDELYRQALQMRPELTGVDFRQPVLAIVETGLAPRKVGTGKYNERLSWNDGGGDAETLSLLAGGRGLGEAVKSESLYYQASTRGGRPVEYLLQGKANFRDGAKTAADIGSAVAMASLVNADLQRNTGNYSAAMNSGYLSLASSLFSLVSSTVERNTTPAADTRAWDSLPGSVWLATPQVAPASIEQLRVVAPGADGVAPQMTGQFGRCAVAWTRLSPVPPPRASRAEEIDASAEARARLHRFQGALPNLF